MDSNSMLNARIKISCDSFNNWMKEDPVLLEGELAIVTITPENDPLGDTPDTILFKVGNNTSKFSELGWTSGLAADVYEWAKSATKPVYSYNDGFLTGFGTAAGKNSIDEISITNAAGLPTSQAVIDYVAKYIVSALSGSIVSIIIPFDYSASSLSSEKLTKGSTIQKIEVKITSSTQSSLSSSLRFISVMNGSLTEKVLLTQDNLDSDVISDINAIPETFIYDGLNYSITGENAQILVDATALTGLAGEVYVNYILE